MLMSHCQCISLLEQQRAAAARACQLFPGHALTVSAQATEAVVLELHTGSPGPAALGGGRAASNSSNKLCYRADVSPKSAGKDHCGAGANLLSTPKQVEDHKNLYLSSGNKGSVHRSCIFPIPLTKPPLGK